MIEHEPEETVEDLEKRGERLEDDIKETRKDWESKQQDEGVPGAQPDDD